MLSIKPFCWALLLFVLNFISIISVNSLDIDNEDHLHPNLHNLNRNEYVSNDELNSEYWINKAQAKIKEKLNQKLNTAKAKNIIIFLGDGMSVHTLTSTRVFIGDTSEELSFEKFPYLGLSKTYCIDSQVADSACSATAYLCGVKGNIGTIGVNGQVKLSHCTQGLDEKNHVDSIAKWAQDAKKATGIVTTTRITHASPSGVYAHTPNRNWECDSLIDKKCQPNKNIDIAEQLIRWPVGKEFKVILGGGRSMFRNNTINDEQGVRGKRTDGKDLIKEWLVDHQARGNSSYVWNRKELMAVNIEKTDYLLGLFSPDHCPYHGDRKRAHLELSDPSLTEMTEIALRMLQKDKNGYFLFVEGGRIDHAHHDTKARKALEDTEEFANAIQMARKMTNELDTLILVTSDHSHTMTINGYPQRGTNILGLSGSKDDHKFPYTSLSYANGPGYYTMYPANKNSRHDLSSDDFTDPNYEYPGTVPLGSETHGGEDVGIFTSGPQAHLFVGNYEQSYIPIMMASIAEIGPFKTKK